MHSWGMGRKIIKFIIPILRGIICTNTMRIICYKHRNVFERTHHCDYKGRLTQFDDIDISPRIAPGVKET